MAICSKGPDGKRVMLLPSHDPDRQDHGLALELAVDRTRDGVIDAARAFEARWRIGTGIDAPTCNKADALVEALAAYDAAVAENRAHDSRVQPEPPPPTWNDRRGVLLSDVNRTRFYLDREQGSLNDFTRMGADPVIIADQKAEVERRRAAWQSAMQRYKDERPADVEPQP